MNLRRCQREQLVRRFGLEPLPKAYEVADWLAQASQTAIRRTRYSLNNWLRQAGPGAIGLDTDFALLFLAAAAAGETWA